MILVTGAAGKSGRAVLKSLLHRDEAVRVMTRTPGQAEDLLGIGAAEAVVGDMSAPESYRRAMPGIHAVYHICPNMHPAEIEIGRLALESAVREGVEHFVYHSVLHPQTEKMPHHWRKMRVEESIFEAPLDFTVLQPAPYMQNILVSKSDLAEKGRYRVPYPPHTCFSLVDLGDLAEAAAEALVDRRHRNAVYEITGTLPLDQAEVADQASKVLGRRVEIEEIELSSWRRQAEQAGLSDYALDSLHRMFVYYARFGLAGNPLVLRTILGREPCSLEKFLARELA